MEIQLKSITDLMLILADKYKLKAVKVIAVLAVLESAMRVYRFFVKEQRRRVWNNAGKDVVVLHQHRRGRNVPNLSASALKLETYLRMANIQYVIDNKEPIGSLRGKSPWITLNGEEFSDSELIIKCLSKKFPQPFTELSAEQRAIGRAVQVMLEEHTIFFVGYKRYVIDNMMHFLNMLPSFSRRFVSLTSFYTLRVLRRKAWIVGYGRYSEYEAMLFLYREIQAVHDLLGEKPFLLGEEVSVYDATVFATLTQIIHCCAPEVEQQMRSKYRRLVQYHERLKQLYWPDWDACRSR